MSQGAALGLCWELPALLPLPGNALGRPQLPETAFGSRFSPHCSHSVAHDRGLNVLSMIATGEAIPLRGLEGVPAFPAHLSEVVGISPSILASSL